MIRRAVPRAAQLAEACVQSFARSGVDGGVLSLPRLPRRHLSCLATAYRLVLFPAFVSDQWLRERLAIHAVMLREDNEKLKKVVRRGCINLICMSLQAAVPNAKWSDVQHMLTMKGCKNATMER